MNKVLKWGAIILVVIFLGSQLITNINKAAEDRKMAESVAAASSSPSEIAKPQEAPSTPEPVKPLNIKVTSQIIKKVGDKHRYFFDIRNNDSLPFEGSVTITLLNDKQKSGLGRETFSTQQPIDPSLGTSVHFDINTGPKSVHGEYGITKFTYVVSQEDKEVVQGEGIITDKYEDSGL